MSNHMVRRDAQNFLTVLSYATHSISNCREPRIFGSFASVISPKITGNGDALPETTTISGTITEKWTEHRREKSRVLPLS